MKAAVLGSLVCPDCGADLGLVPAEREGEEIVEGRLRGSIPTKLWGLRCLRRGALGQSLGFLAREGPNSWWRFLRWSAPAIRLRLGR